MTRASGVRATLAAAVLACVAVAGCGSSSPGFTADERDRYVSAEAEALCLVQRRTFDDPAALDAAVAEARAGAGLSVAVAEKLAAFGEKDQGLREEISERVAGRCG